MNVFRVLIRAGAAVVLCLIAVAEASPRATAQEIGPVCPNSFSLTTYPSDPSLHASLTARWDQTQHGIRLDWSTKGGTICAFFQVKALDGGYSPGFGDLAWADFVTGPDPSARLRVTSRAGEHCFRVFAFSFAGRSQPAEACVTITPEQIPTPAPPGTLPTPVATPWPPPATVQLTGSTILLDPNNFPLPPSRQAWLTGISWAVPSSFNGTYEVQRAQKVPGQEFLWSSLTSGQFPADMAVNGRISFEEQVTSLTQWCFRLRSVINRETGPFSTPVCMEVPPSSGGGAPQPADTPAPLPPDVGNSPAAAGRIGSPLIGLFLALLVFGGTAGIARRCRRRLSPR